MKKVQIGILLTLAAFVTYFHVNSVTAQEAELEVQTNIEVQIQQLSEVFTETQEYKHSFKAHLTGDQVVPPTDSDMRGDAIFNVSMDEREIDYQVDLAIGGGINEIILACAQPGENGPRVVSLYSGSGSSAEEGIAAGTIVDEDLEDVAQTCHPNIHTTSHLVQAMREGSIYITVFTDSFPQGEIRGNLSETDVTVLPPYDDTNDDDGEDSGGDNGGNGGDNDDEDEEDNDNGGGGNRSGSPANPGAFGTGGGNEEGEVLGASTGPTCSIYLTSYIKFGEDNDVYNVALLQHFLNAHMNAGLEVTGVYDTATLNSLNEFQVKYYEEVLKPWVPYGLPTEKTSTGYVYKTTSRMVNNMACGINLPMPMLP